jgi:flavin-dependent dehydrogenase
MVFRYRGQEFRIEQPNALFVVRREQFDEALVRSVQARGIQVREGVALEKLERVEGDGAAGGGWLILHTSAGRIKARAVVGADGAKSLVRRHMGVEEPSRVARAIEILTPEDPSTQEEFVQGVAVFDFSYATDGLQGYVWDFPSKLHGAAYMNRGAGDFRVYPERPMAPMKEFFGQYLQRKGITLSEHKLMGNPSRWYDPGATISTPGIILVGDAAGIEPMGGDGISAAFWYGKEAAEALARGHATGNWSFAGYSRQIAESELGKYLTSRLKQARFIYGIRRPLLFRVVWLVSGWRIQRAARQEMKSALRS